MPRYQLLLEYDGSDFCGWQAQRQASAARPGVQQAVESAIAAFSGEAAATTAAGRTDAGVHAVGQSLHFDLARPRAIVNIIHGINFHLRKAVGKPAVAVTAAREVAATFDARRSAIARHYRYFILLRRPSPLFAERAWCVDYRLDLAAMRAAAKILRGRHDFSAFRRAGCQAKSPIKTLDGLAVHQRGERLIITAASRSFLYNQVRILVGTLAAVGRGRLSVRRVEEILAEGRRPAAAPARGLYLWRVSY